MFVALVQVACAENPARFDAFGAPCAEDRDCNQGDACLPGADGVRVCRPAVDLLVDAGNDDEDAGPEDAGVDAGPEDAGVIACQKNSDCPEEFDGCRVGTGDPQSLQCGFEDESGFRVDFPAFTSVPQLTGASTDGTIVVRHPSITAKPWLTGASADGTITVIGGDFR